MKSQTIRKYPRISSADHLDFVRERPLVFVDGVSQRAGGGQLLQPDQPLLEPFARHVLEVTVQREVRRHLEVRQVGGAFLEGDVAPLGNPNAC